MGISDKKILVPTDFTKVSETALEHALLVAKTIEANIYVTHIVDNKKHIAEVRLKLDSIRERVLREHNFEINDCSHRKYF